MGARSVLVIVAALASLALAAGQVQARDAISLNGEWQYVYADAASAPGGETAWQSITVPSVLEWQPDGPHCVWYRKKFSLPSAWRGRRIILRLDGVKYAHRALLNGREVGRHVGGYEPAEYDVTAQARLGEENELLVAAQDWTALLLPGTAGEITPGAEFVSWVKDGIIAPIGSHGSEVGIWQGVRVEARPEVWVDDVFVTTSVRQHTRRAFPQQPSAAHPAGQGNARVLRVEVTLHNAGARPAQVEVRPEVVSGGPGPDLGAQAVTVPAGGEGVVTFAASWPEAHLWSPDDPHLYTLRVQAGKDAREVRFGFREFWAEGERLILNGTPIRLLATAAHPMAEYDADPKKAYAIAKSAGCVAMRLHAQPWPQQWYDAADEAGMLLVWESGLWCYSPNYALGHDEFWENARRHIAAQMKLHRNHPSVVIWSAENELLLCGGDQVQGTEERLGALADFMRGLDPTRPVMCDGDADPAGKFDIINLHYPREFPAWNLWPETAYWFDSTITPDTFPRREWKWDRRKPLYLGEFLWVPAEQLDAGSIFFGDAIYPDPAAYHLRAKATAWEMQVIAARDADVAGMCPWNFWEGGGFPNPGSEAHRRGYQPVAAFPKDLGTRVFSEEVAQRTLMVFNDSPRARDLEVRWRLKAEVGAWETSGSERLSLSPTERAHVTAKLTVPAIERAVVPAQFTVEVWEGKEKLFSESHPWKVFRRGDVLHAAGTAQSLAVYDPVGKTAQMLRKLGCALTALTPENATKALARARVVAVGKGAFAREAGGRIVVGRKDGFSEQLRRFVERGGTLVVFEQEVYPGQLIPLTLSDYGATIAFVRDRSHAILRGLDDTDLAHWLPDGLVARREIVKPTHGGFRTLVDSGGERGLETAGLAELRLGRGRMILCQLNVSDRVEVEPSGVALTGEPAAAAVVQHMLRDAATSEQPTGLTAVMASDAAAAKRAHSPSGECAVLDAIGLRYQRITSPLRESDLRRFGQLIVADPTQLAGSEEAVRRFVSEGGKVVLHNISPAGVSTVERLLRQPIVLQKGAQGHVSLTDRSGPAAALTAQDLAWFGAKPAAAYAVPELTSELADATLVQPHRPAGPPVRIEAETMQVSGAVAQRLPLDGGDLPAGGQAGMVAMLSNGDLAGGVTIPKAGAYAVVVRARGTPAAGAFARLTLLADDRPLGSAATTADWQDLVVVGDLPAGPQTLKLVFANDLVTGAEDRNVWVDWVEVTPIVRVPTTLRFHTEPGVLVSLPEGKGLWVIDQVRWDRDGGNGDKAARYLATLLTNLGCEFEAESGEPIEPSQMKVTGELVTRSPESVALGTNGELEAEVEFATTGRYTFALLASGTPLDEVYPRVELRLDGTTVGTIDLQGSDWRTYQLTVPVSAGVHRVVAAFVNDAWRPPQDRNLSVARLTITAGAAEQPRSRGRGTGQ